MQTSLICSNLLFFAPVRPITFMPFACAVVAAYSTFLLLPLVDIAKNTSPTLPYPYTCCAKHRSGSQSFMYAVDNAGCPSSAIAGSAPCRFSARTVPSSSFSLTSLFAKSTSGFLGSLNPFINSPTICSASAAEPPFPATSNFPPFLYDSASKKYASTISFLTDFSVGYLSQRLSTCFAMFFFSSFTFFCPTNFDLHIMRLTNSSNDPTVTFCL